MPDADQDPRWIKMYEDFLAQTEPAELSKQLEPLEAAIAERRNELEGQPTRIRNCFPLRKRWKGFWKPRLKS